MLWTIRCTSNIFFLKIGLVVVQKTLLAANWSLLTAYPELPLSQQLSYKRGERAFTRFLLVDAEGMEAKRLTE